MMYQGTTKTDTTVQWWRPFKKNMANPKRLMSKGKRMQRKFLFFAVFWVSIANTFAQVTVNVTTPGTLCTQVGAQKNSITNLRVIGNLNGADILCLREMAGSDINGSSTSGNLAILDLKDANIIASSGTENRYYGTNVTSNNTIGNNMFYNCSKLTSITLPSSVTTIGNNAFQYAGLTDVSIPSNVTSIGTAAFDGCNGLTNVIFEDGKTTLSFGYNENTYNNCPISNLYLGRNVDNGNSNYSSFKNKTALTTLIIGNDVTSIGNNAFYNCTGLTNVTVGNSVTSIGNSAFIYGGFSSISIPNGVTSIGSSAFEGSELSSISIPASVISIGSSAFADCRKLMNVVFEDGKTTLSFGYNEDAFNNSPIGNLYLGRNVNNGNSNYSSFKNKTALTSLTIGNDVTSIGNNAFYDCNGLVNVTVGNNVTSIGNSAFTYGRFSSINIPNGVISIGNSVFEGSELTCITIPASVTSIGSSAFADCRNLMNVVFEDGKTTLSFGYNEDTFNNSPIGYLYLGRNVNNGNSNYSSFKNKGVLATLTIGNEVTSIGNNAFLDCVSLTEIHSQNPTPPSAAVNCFFNVYATCKLYVPGGSASLYNQVNQPEWKKFFDYGNGFEKDGTTPEIIVSPTSFNFPPSDGSETITVTSNQSWTASSNTSWLTLSPESGSGNGTITIEITENTSTSSRNATVTITGGGLSRQINITQNAISGNYLTISPETFNFGASGGSTTITVSSNQSWSLSSNASWLTPSLTNGSNNGTFTVTATTNTSTSSRNATVTVTGGGISKAVSVTQDWAANYERTVNVTTPGTLCEQIVNPNSITSLKVTGNLNGADILCLREMAGSDKAGSTTSGNLAILDLKDANIIASSGATNQYYGTTTTSDNAIGNNMFYNCRKLTSIILPSSVTTIGNNAFQFAGLTSISIPSNVTSIGAAAFDGCNGLTNVILEEGKTTLSFGYNEDTFNNCPIDNLYLGRNVDNGNSNYSSFKNKTALTTLTIGNDVTSIGNNAFYNCTELTSVTVGNRVTSIGNSAFIYGGFSSISIPNGVTEIGSSAFEGSELSSISIPASVISIGSSAFADCRKLMNVVFEDGKTTLSFGYNEDAFNNSPIGNLYLGRNVNNGNSNYSSFKNKTALTSLTIGNDVTFIGNNAFYDCNGLKNVTVGESVNSIGNSAFSYCEFANINIPDGVISIGNSAFEKSALTSITIPASVTSIEASAFADCNKLTNVVFEDGKTTLSFGYNENTFNNCPISYLYFGRNVNNGNSSYSSFKNKKELTALTIGKDVTSIGNNAFSGCSGLNTPVNIPNSVTSIGSSAFDGCILLPAVSLGSNVETIDASAFNQCSALTSMTIPQKVNTIAGSAFANCDKLASITIENSLTTLNFSGSNTFNGCNNIRTLHLGRNITNSTSTAYIPFYGKTSLTSLTIGSNVTSISANAFSGCNNLIEIHSQNPEPPIVANTNSFNGVNKETCILFVPVEAIGKYEVANVWKDFLNILIDLPLFAFEDRFDYTPVGGTTPVTIYSIANWTATVSDEWLALNIATGAEGFTRTAISVAKNTNPQSRTATITLKGEGIDDFVINVVQEADEILPLTGEIKSGVLQRGNHKVYRLPANDDLIIRITDSQGVADIAVGFESLPDVAGAKHGTTYISNSIQGDYYVLVSNNALNEQQSQSFSISARAIDMEITQVFADTIIRHGSATIPVEVIGCAEMPQFALVKDGKHYAAEKVHVFSEMLFSVEFNVESLEIGDYDIYVSAGGRNGMKEKAIYLKDETPRETLETKIVLPSTSRIGSTISAYVEYINTGNVDIPAPLLILSGTPGSTYQVGNSEIYTDEIHLIGLNAMGILNRLRPGEGGRIEVKIGIPLQQIRTADYSLRILSHNAEGMDAPFYLQWLNVEPSIVPNVYTQEEWDGYITRLRGLTGDTWASFVEGLSVVEGYLMRSNMATVDAQKVYEYMKEIAMVEPEEEEEGTIRTMSVEDEVEPGTIYIWGYDDENQKWCWLPLVLATYELICGSNGCIEGSFKEFVRIERNFEKYDFTKPTIFISHGMNNNRKSLASKGIAEALASRSDLVDYNIIGVDWGKWAKETFIDWNWTMPWPSAYHIPEVVNRVFENLNLINEKIKIEHFIGHSHGAHVCGLLAQRFKDNDRNRIPDRLTTLDASTRMASLFKQKNLKWDNTSAKYIDFYKSSTLGTSDFRGTDNFILIEKENTFDFEFQTEDTEIYKHGYAVDWYIKTIYDSSIPLGFNFPEPNNNQLKWGEKKEWEAKEPNQWHGVINGSRNTIECLFVRDNLINEDEYSKWRYTKPWYNGEEFLLETSTQTFRGAFAGTFEFAVDDKSIDLPKMLSAGTSNTISLSYSNRADNLTVKDLAYEQFVKNSGNALFVSKSPTIGADAYLIDWDNKTFAAPLSGTGKYQRDVPFSSSLWKYFGGNENTDSINCYLIFVPGMSKAFVRGLVTYNPATIWDGELYPDNNYISKEITIYNSALWCDAGNDEEYTLGQDESMKTVQLSGEATTSSSGQLIYSWFYGIDRVSNEKSFSHSFPVGEHKIMLLVTHGSNIASDYVTITILPPPPPPGGPGASNNTSTLASWDPNEKVGIKGAGDKDCILPGASMDYTIFFENDPKTANAPAQEVRVIDVLDEAFDLSTFSFTGVRVANRDIAIQQNVAHTTVTTDLRPDNNLLLRTTLNLDIDTRTVTATFTSLDPESYEFTTDPWAGFLYPNDETHRGEGQFSYRVSLKDNLPDGYEIKNQANIYFDWNAPIETNVTSHLIDSAPPSSSVNGLPASTEGESVLVSWGGLDAGSGIRYYDIYVSDNGGIFNLWQAEIAETSAYFYGELAHTYSFFSVATDWIGHVETKKSQAEASISFKSCTTPPNYDTALPAPTNEWQTHSSSIQSGGCYVYRVSITSGQKYTFKTGCGDGATADFGTEIFLYDNLGDVLTWVPHGGCESSGSKIEDYLFNYDGYAYVRIKGFGAIGESTTYGNYTLAYRITTVPSDDFVVINGVPWATRNINQPGTFAPSPEDAGMIYQWNRKIGWSSTNPLINSNGGNTWDGSMPTGTTWEEANDPSPAGWRIPTSDEIQKLSDTNKVNNEWTTVNGVYGTKFTDKSTGQSVFLPATAEGYRHPNTGEFFGVGNCYWSSTQNGNTTAYSLDLGIDGVRSEFYHDRRDGLLVRSVKKIGMELSIDDITSNETTISNLSQLFTLTVTELRNRTASNLARRVGFALYNSTGSAEIGYSPANINFDDLQPGWGWTEFPTNISLNDFSLTSMPTGGTYRIYPVVSEVLSSPYRPYIFIKGTDNSDKYVTITISSPITPPTVTTLAATNITQTTATLNKVVTAGTETITEQGFQYRVSGVSSWNISTNGNLTGLTANTIYEFCAYATTSSGTTYGNTVTFTTLTVVNVPANDQCTNATDLSCNANLNGTTVGTTAKTGTITTNSSPYGVWYSFLGDGYQTTITSVAGADFDHAMGIYSGSCVGLTHIVTKDYEGSGGTETHTFNTTSGTRYYIYVAYYSTSGGSMQTGIFSISRTCTPNVQDNDFVVIDGVSWATRNVDSPGTFATKSEDAGKFYQWNRNVAWAATGSVSGWNNSTPSGTSWEKANDPCPSGWRVPTQVELQKLINAVSTWATQNGVSGRRFGSGSNTIFLPAAGYRINDGTLFDIGSFGHYWGSTQYGSNNAYYMGFHSGGAYMNNDRSRASGWCVRCVKENSTDINEVAANQLQIFPNPAKTEIFIKSELPIEKVEICSITGTLLLLENNFNEKLSVSALPNGVYLLKIYTDKGLVVSKIVKE